MAGGAVAYSVAQVYYCLTELDSVLFVLTQNVQRKAKSRFSAYSGQSRQLVDRRFKKC
jgi:hypothetical protein